jgi:hypothetical protein
MPCAIVACGWAARRWRCPKRLSFASSVTLGASFYTMIVLVIGEFFLGKPLSETIKLGFGDGRIAWLLVALAVDTSTRIVTLFDGVKD